MRLAALDAPPQLLVGNAEFPGQGGAIFGFPRSGYAPKASAILFSSSELNLVIVVVGNRSSKLVGREKIIISLGPPQRER
jgi:hypothetical protein